jgi:hypothetical protein
VIHEISLNDCLDGTSPPEQVLTVSACDDAVFVRICKIDQDSRTEKHTELAEISVSLPSLIEALTLLAADAEREHLRPLDSTGKSHETRLAGHRLAVVHTGGSSLLAAETVHLGHTPHPKAGRDAGGEQDA